MMVACHVTEKDSKSILYLRLVLINQCYALLNAANCGMASPYPIKYDVTNVTSYVVCTK